MSEQVYLALDMGAESGRVIKGTLCEGKVTLEEIHRFSNGPVNIQGTMRWNILSIFEELRKGVFMAAKVSSVPVSSISCNSWGVDYALFSDEEPLLCQPFNYRDPRTDGWLNKAAKKLAKKKIYDATGIQFMELNTLYQLLAHTKASPALFKGKMKFLNIGDYLNYLFSGVAKSEESLASTTQLYDTKKKKWSEEIRKAFGFEKKFYPEVVKSGTVLGGLSLADNDEANLAETRVVASCSHDTACAVAAVPAQENDRNWAFLSSGTWSLMGVELDEPVIDSRTYDLQYTNEAGFDGTTRFLKNIVGLFVLQECKRHWEKQGHNLDYGTLTDMAKDAEPMKILLDLREPVFGTAGSMPEKITDYCKETEQPLPENSAEMVRAILDSLALIYKQTKDELESLTDRKLERLHIVGGGSKNKLLNQIISDVTGMEVHAGPTEATSAGNILVQAYAMGHVKDISEMRSIVRSSFMPEVFKPEQKDFSSVWEKFLKLSKA